MPAGALKTPANADFPALVLEFKEFEDDTKKFFANFRKVIGRNRRLASTVLNQAKLDLV